jgi:hypothetical protein
MAVPLKYREMMTFWKYYSGQKAAPIPTLFGAFRRRALTNPCPTVDQ